MMNEAIARRMFNRVKFLLTRYFTYNLLMMIPRTPKPANRKIIRNTFMEGFKENAWNPLNRTPINIDRYDTCPRMIMKNGKYCLNVSFIDESVREGSRI